MRSIVRTPDFLSKHLQSSLLKVSFRGKAFSSVIKEPEKIQSKYDVIVVGAGHNGLVSAAYLAKHGFSVGVFERRHLIGGAAVTEEIVPGYKFSRASYVLSLLRPLIIKELQLHKYGLEIFMRTSPHFTPMYEKGIGETTPRYLLTSSDHAVTYNEISKFSKNDAKAFQLYEDSINKMSAAVKPLLDIHMPDGNASFMENLQSSMPLLRAVRQLGMNEIGSFYELVTAPISKILNRWFESEPLKATLAVDGVIGAMLSPNTPGSGYVLLHHVIGECNGVPGSWGFVKGGMGAVSNSIACSATESGAEIFVSQEVKELSINNGICNGIVLDDGRHIMSDVVLSNATPHVTFNKLLPDVASMPDDDGEVAEYLKHISHFDYTSPVTKINVAVDKLPNFAAYPNKSYNEVGEQHKGTIHINCEEMDNIHNAYVDAMNGIPSKLPMIEMCIPSSLDPTLAPAGHHVISLFTQYTPYYLHGDKNWSEDDKTNYAGSVFSSIEKYAPGFKDSIVGVDILTPKDLEDVFGITGGNIFHGAMSLDQLFISRPTNLYSSCETPISGLYLCGSSTHPGGGVMGSSGRLAALRVMKKRKK